MTHFADNHVAEMNTDADAKFMIEVMVQVAIDFGQFFLHIQRGEHSVAADFASAERALFFGR